MSVYLPADCVHYRYDFQLNGKRHLGSTGQRSEADAQRWEGDYRKRLERRAAGLEPLAPEDTPRIADWAAVYYRHVTTDPDRAVTRPERIADLLRVVLRFWGAEPDGRNQKNPPVDGEPYHDLRLGDPIADSDWIVKFEDWMTARGRAGQTRNQYRSVMNQMYTLAHQPKYRKVTGVTPKTNPFDGIFRSRTATRDVTIDPQDLRRLLAHASYHLRLAVAIGALAPKLRLANILGLRWAVHFDRELKFITLGAHKTVQDTGRPMVMPVSAQLRAILQDARRRRPGSTYVVTYRGSPVKSVRGALAGAAKAAGLPYGRSVPNGLTFHTLRHTAATLLAELDVGESKRKSVMGHERMETTQRYTHLRPVHEVVPLERLSETIPIEDIVTQPWLRASRTAAAGQSAGVAPESQATDQANAGQSDTRSETS